MRLRAILPGLLILLVCLAAYFPTLHNGFIWDDNNYIQRNGYLQDLDGLKHIWLQLDSEPQFYPVTHTTLWIEYHLWELRPFGYHLDNILLHAASAILLWRILLRLSIPGALIAAIFFAVHPVQVESIAWATERKNVLSGLFYLLFLWAYLRTNWGLEIVNKGETKVKESWEWYIVSLLFFILAILSKSVTSTAPAAVLLLIWWKRGRITRQDVWPLAPMFALAIVMGCITGWMEKHVVGAVGSDFDFSFLDRVCIAGRAVCFYLAKLFWPVNLMFIYPRWEIDPLLRPWQLLWPLSTLASLLALSMMRRHIGRGPLAAFLFFIGTLFPALGFVDVFPMRYSFVADHFQYLAAIGPIVLFSAVLARSLPGWSGIAVVSVLAAVFCVADFQRSEIYFDRSTLWTATLKQNPDSPMVHANYAGILLDSGDINGAESHFRRAMQLRHWATDALDIGNCNIARKDYPTAIKWFTLAFDEIPQSSEPILHRLRAQPLMQIGNAYVALSRQQSGATTRIEPQIIRQYQDQAIVAYQRAIEIDPGDSQAMTNLGQVLSDQGKIDQAIEQYHRALALDPDSIIAHEDLGDALVEQGQMEAGIAEFQTILRIQPDNVTAIINIGAVRARQGRWDQAIAEFKAALNIDPTDTRAQYQMMEAFIRKTQETKSATRKAR